MFLTRSVKVDAALDVEHRAAIASLIKEQVLIFL